MLIILISGIITFLGCIYMYLYFSEKLFKQTDRTTEIAMIVSMCLLVFGCTFLGCGIGALVVNSKQYKESERLKYKTKRNSLEQRIENWKNGDNSDATLWSDVQDYNVSLLHEQYWANSKWTSWMNCPVCKDFETIEIPTYSNN